MKSEYKDVRQSDKKVVAKNNSIIIHGARMHNLKNVDVELPRNRLIVVTGVSGSGKSTLTIDTLFAEGQRRYVESLSSYARQFLNRMDKPEVDFIHGLCPAIAIEQKVSTRSSRSTVGSLTEIYDYLRLLFARVGKTYSPKSGNLVQKHEVSDVVNYMAELNAGTRIYICFDTFFTKSWKEDLALLQQKGFLRLWIAGAQKNIEDVLDEKHDDVLIRVIVDRMVAGAFDDDTYSRLADSVQTAFNEGNGYCTIITDDGEQRTFSHRFEADGIGFEIPTPHFFNFSSPYGACKTCEGFGTVMGIDEDLIFPDKNLSVYEGAVAPWRGEKMSEWLEPLIKKGILFDFPIHRSYRDLADEHRKLLWSGNEYFKGLSEFFRYLEEKSYKIQYRVMMSRYRGKTICPDCNGSRVRADAQYVKVGGKNISELLLMQVKELHVFFSKISLSNSDHKIADRILTEVNSRLQMMMDVGLSYLSLNRLSNTLSGGETQRINLTRTIGSNLTGSMYILDEPSIGLHQRDTKQLIDVLKKLRDLGNTVIVVEHDEDMMRNSDHILDIGPDAGVHGGRVVYNGEGRKLLTESDTYTAKYLRGEMDIPFNRQRRKFVMSLELKGAAQHNLKDVNVTIPMNALTVVCGVSGSGKTTLIKNILYPALLHHLGEGGEKPGTYQSLVGAFSKIKSVEMIDQHPLGRSSRSNPVTYVKAYDSIRELFASQQLSKVRGYQPKDFSFNVEGGRCETCKGEGEVVVEMQFLADVHLKCEACNGHKFKENVLEVQYNGKNIYEVLELSIDEALDFFSEHKDITDRILPLQQVGLGYVKMGQSSSTLSGGEAQRVKLASFLTRGAQTDHVLFIFDEPTTGLHFHDINKLMNSFQQLIKAGHTVLVIEHNMDVIKCADWLIELGPEGGNEGGYLVYQGVPEGLAKVPNSPTAPFLLPKLNL